LFIFLNVVADMKKKKKQRALNTHRAVADNFGAM
jgi:hypothetical protein